MEKNYRSQTQTCLLELFSFFFFRRVKRLLQPGGGVDGGGVDGGARDGPTTPPKLDKLQQLPRLGGGSVVVSVDDVLTALESDVVRVAPEMKAQEVSGTMWSLAKLERMSEEEGAWGALEMATVRTAPEMVPQAVSNAMLGLATIGRMPGEETWGALERATVRLASEMNAQCVVNITWSYAMLGRIPGGGTWGGG